MTALLDDRESLMEDICGNCDRPIIWSGIYGWIHVESALGRFCFFGDNSKTALAQATTEETTSDER